MINANRLRQQDQPLANSSAGMPHSVWFDNHVRTHSLGAAATYVSFLVRCGGCGTERSWTLWIGHGLTVLLACSRGVPLRIGIVVASRCHHGCAPRTRSEFCACS